MTTQDATRQLTDAEYIRAMKGNQAIRHIAEVAKHDARLEEIALKLEKTAMTAPDAKPESTKPFSLITRDNLLRLQAEAVTTNWRINARDTVLMPVAEICEYAIRYLDMTEKK